MPEAGLFITFEGGDGSGKTTQIQQLSNYLSDVGYRVCTTREPGGTAIGAQLREIVLHSRENIAARTEALLYAADRAQHIAELVRPALEQGQIVLQDRYIDSSLAYQGAGRVLEVEEIREISAWATEDLTPDLTFVFDLSPELSQQRRSGQKRQFDRLESEAAQFHERVRQGFLTLAASGAPRYRVIDASQSIEKVSAEVISQIELIIAARADAGIRVPQLNSDSV